MIFTVDPLPDPFARIKQLAVDAPEALTLAEKDATIGLLDRVLLNAFGRVAESNWPSLLRLGGRLKGRIMDYPMPQSSLDEEVQRLYKELYPTLDAELAEDRALFERAMKYGDYILHAAYEQLPDYARQNIVEPLVGCSKCKSDWDTYFSRIGATKHPEMPRVPDIFRYDWARPKPVLILKGGRREELRF